MKILGIIPARYGSTRFKGKPLADICGKTMIQRVYEQAAKMLEKVVVATDDVRIFKEVEKFGGHVVMTSASHTTGTNRCFDAYQKLNESFDIVVNVQGDEPLLEPKQLQELTNCFADLSVQMATLVMPVKAGEQLADGKAVYVILDKNNDAIYFSRSVIPHIRACEKTEWTKQHTYYKHVGLYAFAPKVLEQFSTMSMSKLEQVEHLEQLRWLENGNKIRVAKTHYQTIAVDTPEDLERVKQLIN